MRDFKRKDIFISILIVSVTLLYFVDRYLIPEDLKTISILGFEIGSFGFIDISNLVYFSKMKLLILFFAITWYLTCRHWWKPAILVIIILELFKLISVFNSKAIQLDEIEYLTSLPITLPVIILLLLISSKLTNYRISNEVRNSLDKEIDDIFLELNEDKLRNLDLLKKKIVKVKNESKGFGKKKYLKKLILIRNEFYKS